jgi:gentisate 1,2-dioxygenase
VRPYLVRAGELVKEKDAERRVLMLVNPARGESSVVRLNLDVSMSGIANS